MSPIATPATQSEGGCHQVTRMPRKVKVAVTKCHAWYVDKLCVMKCVNKLREDKLRVDKLYKVTVDVTKCHACHACHAK